MSKVISNKPDKLVSLRSITMGRGTPEQDLDTHMDNIDQQEAELNQEKQEAEDTAWGIHEFIDSASKLLSADCCMDMEVTHQVTDHILRIDINMTEVESEVLTDYINQYGSKFVRIKVLDED